MDDDDDFDFNDRMDDECGYEVIGSCDECEQDIDEDDCYYIDGLRLCGRCAWIAMGEPGP